MSRIWNDRHKHPLSNPIIHIAAADAPAPKRQQPNDKGSPVPNEDERHLPPVALLLQSPDADQPGHREAEPHIGADIGETDSGGGMHDGNSQSPWQSLRENQAHVAPGAHVAHDRHPTKTFDEKIPEGIVVWNSPYGVRKQLDFVTLLGNQPAHQKIVGGAVLDGLIAAKSREARASRNNCLSQGKLDSVQLARYENYGIEVGNHADGVKMLRKRLVIRRDIKAGHPAHLWIAQWRYNGAQIIRLDPNIAVVDHQDFVPGFIHHPNQLRHFVVDAAAPRTIKHSNATLREIPHQLLKNRHGGIVIITDAKKQLVVRIILPALSGEVFIRLGVQAPDGF